MQRFNSLEVQKNIEEKRLILGQKIEAFLLKKISQICDFFTRIFAAKSCAFFGSTIIILISVLAQSSRDIGYKSAFYLSTSEMSIFYAIFLVNLSGILSLYFTQKILARSEFIKDQSLINLIVLSFAGGFFLRVFTLQFNEFLTFSSYFLACVFPYFSYQLLVDEELKKIDHLIIAFLAATLFFLNPSYGILVIIFEAAKFLRSKSFASIFCFRNFITLILVAIFYQKSSNLEIGEVPLFTLLKEDIFPVALFAFLCSFLIKKDFLLQQFSLLSFASALIVFAQIHPNYDQRFIFHSLSLALIVLLTFFIIKGDLVSWKKDGIFLASIFFISQFDAKNIFALALDIPSFWWVIVFIFSSKFLKNSWSWILFGILAFMTISMSFAKETAEIFWIVSAIIFSLLLTKTPKFSRLTSCVIFTILSYFIALHISAVFNLKLCSECFYNKSPNHVNSEMIKIAKLNSGKDEGVVVIAEKISEIYPAIFYMNKKQDVIFDNWKEQIADKKNKLVFVKIENRPCEIGLLEQNLRDKEFRKIFLKNYRFLNRIIERKTLDKNVEFFANQNALKPLEKPEIIERDVEVYIRK